MRWDGQILGDVGGLDDFGEPAAKVPRIGRAPKPGSAQELPGLEMRGLLRTVTTPEFEGIRFHEVAARSALNKVPGDSPVPFRWTINPYRGCSHACVYCFARSTHKYLELDTGRGFDTEIVVKTNVAPVLAAELKKRSWRREHVALGTNTDPYQRAEGRYRLMPGIIGALATSGTPFSILTKGTLLRRDIALLKAAARDVPVGLGVSIAIWDDDLHEALEPGTPSPKARLDLVRALADAGLPCGVFMAPVLPGMTDTVEHLEHAISRLAESGATGVMVMPLHLRTGAREWFLDWLARTHPAMVRHYRRLYGRGAYVTPEYRRWLNARVAPILAAHGLDRSAGGELRSSDPVPDESPDGSPTGVPGDPKGRFPRGSLPDSRPRDGTASAPTSSADQLTLL